MRDLWDFSRQLLSGPDPQMANVKIGREALCPTDNAEMYAMTMTLPEPDLMGSYRFCIRSHVRSVCVKLHAQGALTKSSHL
jgi:hypothetical protein